jgi:hypothetical protein
MGISDSREAQSFETTAFDPIDGPSRHRKITIKSPSGRLAAISDAVIDVIEYELDGIDDLDRDSFHEAVVGYSGENEYCLRDAICTSRLPGIRRTTDGSPNFIADWSVLTRSEQAIKNALDHGKPVMFVKKSCSGVVFRFSSDTGKFCYISYPEMKHKYVRYSSEMDCFVFIAPRSAEPLVNYAFASDSDSDSN